MTVNERHGILRVTFAQQAAARTFLVVPAGYRTDCVPTRLEIQCHKVPVSLLDAPDDLVVTRVALHERDIRIGGLVVVVVVPVVETVTFVVTESVIFHYVPHPFQVCLEHVLYIHIVMCPVARTVPVVAVVVVARRFAVALACIGIEVHFVVLAYIRCIRMKRSVLPEIQLRKVAPTRPALAVVNHNIRNHFRSGVMKRTYQRFQLLACAPVRVLVAVFLRVITCTRTVGARRKPHQVEVRTYLRCLRKQCRPTRVPYQLRTRSIVVVRVVEERLHQHVLTLFRHSRTKRLLNLACYRQADLPVCHANGYLAFRQQRNHYVPVVVLRITLAAARGIHFLVTPNQSRPVTRSDLELVRTCRQILETDLIVSQFHMIAPTHARQSLARNVILRRRRIIATRTVAYI